MRSGGAPAERAGAKLREIAGGLSLLRRAPPQRLREVEHRSGVFVSRFCLVYYGDRIRSGPFPERIRSGSDLHKPHQRGPVLCVVTPRLQTAVIPEGMKLCLNAAASPLKSL